MPEPGGINREVIQLFAVHSTIDTVEAEERVGDGQEEGLEDVKTPVEVRKS